MAQRKSAIPKSAVATLFLDAGAPRVSKEAVQELLAELERRALELGAKAVKAAQHAGRKTVTADDVRLARQ